MDIFLSSPVRELRFAKSEDSMLKEIMLGIALLLLIASAAMALGQFLQPLRSMTMSVTRWLLSWAALGLFVPSLILLIYPPNTDVALNATSSHFLWPTVIMLMAADPYTPAFGVAIVIAFSVVANIVVYISIALVVWIVAHCARRKFVPRH